MGVHMTGKVWQFGEGYEIAEYVHATPTKSGTVNRTLYIVRQDGNQVETCDNWSAAGNIVHTAINRAQAQRRTAQHEAGYGNW